MILGIISGGTPLARPVGEVILTQGSPSFVVPAGVNFFHAVLIGRPGLKRQISTNEWRGGGGGGLSWRNNIPCSPGQTVTFIDQSYPQNDGSYCRIEVNGVVMLVVYNGSGQFGGQAVAAGTYPDFESYAGGSAASTSGAYTFTGGGSAAGYRSNGAPSQAVPTAPATGSPSVTVGITGSGGSGGSGAGVTNARNATSPLPGGQGGGTTLMGLYNGDDPSNNGLGGRVTGNAGNYNGLDGSTHGSNYTGYGGGDPGSPVAVARYLSGCRIIWGDGRSFPYNAAPVT